MYTGSAYEAIKANIGIDGKLPLNFSLEDKPPQNQIRFMPGAMDGTIIYHGDIGSNKRVAGKVVTLLKKYFKTEEKHYIAQVEEILAKNGALWLIDLMLKSFRKSHKGIDPNNMINMSLDLIQTSSNVELIKIGIGLLGLFDFDGEDAEEIAEVLSTLALYEEFTLYAVIAARSCENSNNIIFEMAKSVVGWGRVHAVERLKPESDEIRQWILRSGCSSSVMGSYLGLTCAVKGDLISALKEESIDDELFDSIGIIVAMLIDEGAADGISKYEYAQEALVHYLNHAKLHANCATHLKRILDLQSWAENAEVDYAKDILALCAEIIEMPTWKEKILSVVNSPVNNWEFFCACTAADYFSIDVTTELFNAFKAEPLQYSFYIPQILNNPNFAAPLINLCEVILPLDEMAQGMGDYTFSDTLTEEHKCLDYILPELAAYPHQGMKLIKAGLNSRVIRERNMACVALSGWVNALDMPLESLSPDLYAEIVEIYKTEVYEYTKEAMGKLLAGEAGDV